MYGSLVTLNENYSAVLGGLLVIFLFHSCSNKQELRSVEEAFSVKFETDFFMPISKDSVLIDIHGNEYYDENSMLDRDQYLNNNLFLVGTNGLDVSVVDTTGRLIQNITRRGYGPGEIPIGNNAAIWQSSDGGIYVLNGGNTYTLFVFDRKIFVIL